MRNYDLSERNSHFWSPSVVAFKRFFSFCSSSISEIKSEVGKQLQLQTGGGGRGYISWQIALFVIRNETKNLKGC